MSVLSQIQYQCSLSCHSNLVLVSILIPIILASNIKIILRYFLRVSIKSWIILLCITVSGAALRILIAEPTLLIGNLFEYDYLLRAKEISDQNLLIFLLKSPTYCFTRPFGFIFLLSRIFVVFGSSIETAFKTNLVISILSIPLIFLFTYSFTENKDISLTSSLLLSVFPLHIKYSASLTLMISSIFFTLLTMTFLVLYSKDFYPRMLLSALTCLAFTIQVRGENALLILMFGIFVLFFKAEIFNSTRRRTSLLCLSLFFLIVSPHLIYGLLDIQSYAIYFCNTMTLIALLIFAGIILFKKNKYIVAFCFIALLALISFVLPRWNIFFDLKLTPIAFSALMIIGIIPMFRWNKNNTTFLLIWFFVFFSLYNISGTNNIPLKESRYHLNTIIIPIILASFGLHLIFTKKRNLALIITILLSASPFLYYPLIKDSNYNMQNEFKFFEKAITPIPPNSTIVVPSANPDIAFPLQVSFLKFLLFHNKPPAYFISIGAFLEKPQFFINNGPVIYYQSLFSYQINTNMSFSEEKIENFVASNRNRRILKQCDLMQNSFQLKPILTETFENRPFYLYNSSLTTNPNLRNIKLGIYKVAQSAKIKIRL